MGLRERKKERTRAALVEGAFRLFAEHGYDRTTVASIAASADVATRTFFSYFDSKEDVVFFDDSARLERALAVIDPRRPLSTTLRRILDEAVLAPALDTDLALALAPQRTALIAEVPALQARELHLLFATQRELATAVHRAYPRSPLVDVAAAVGALVGALKLAADMTEGDPRRAGRRAGQLVVKGLAVLD